MIYFVFVLEQLPGAIVPAQTLKVLSGWRGGARWDKFLAR